MNSDVRSLKNYAGTRTNQFSMFRAMKVNSWLKKDGNGVASKDNNKLTNYLVYNNNNVDPNVQTNAHVADASDYIRFKTIGAATRDFSKQ